MLTFIWNAMDSNKLIKNVEELQAMEQIQIIVINCLNMNC